MSNNNNNKSKNKNKKKVENEHLPRYIKTQPWYYKTTDDESKTKTQEDKDDNDDVSEKDYLQHHRSKNSNITNNDEATIGTGIKDEFNIIGSDKARKDDITYDANKDRWYGYDEDNYQKIIDEWDTKKSMNEDKNLNNKKINEETFINDLDVLIEIRKLDLDLNDAINFLIDVNNEQLSSKATSVRLREDKAAYLQDIGNLDGSINYDPKSRLYKTEELGKVDEKGNMFRRHLTGEGKELEELNKFTRELSKNDNKNNTMKKDKSANVLIANPTRMEQLHKRQKQEQETQQNNNKKIKIVQLKDCEAQKSKGTTMTDESRSLLKDLYG